MDFSGFDESRRLFKEEFATVNELQPFKTYEVNTNKLEKINNSSIEKKFITNTVFCVLNSLCLIFSIAVFASYVIKCTKKNSTNLEKKLCVLKRGQTSLGMTSSVFFMNRTITTLTLNLAKYSTLFSSIACDVVDTIALFSFYSAEILLFSSIFVIHKKIITSQVFVAYNSKLVKAGSFLVLLCHTAAKTLHCASYVMESGHEMVKGYGCVDKSIRTSQSNFDITLNLAYSVLGAIMFLLCFYPLCCHLRSTKDVSMKNVQRTREKIKYKFYTTLAVFVFYALSDILMFSIIYCVGEGFSDNDKHLLFDFCLVLQFLAVQIAFSKSKVKVFCCSKNNKTRSSHTALSRPTSINISHNNMPRKKKLSCFIY